MTEQSTRGPSENIYPNQLKGSELAVYSSVEGTLKTSPESCPELPVQEHANFTLQDLVMRWRGTLMVNLALLCLLSPPPPKSLVHSVFPLPPPAGWSD